MQITWCFTPSQPLRLYQSDLWSISMRLFGSPARSELQYFRRERTKLNDLNTKVMAYWTDTMQFTVSSSDQVNINKWAGRESPTVEYSTAKESGKWRRVWSTGCKYDHCLVLSSLSLSLLWVIHGLTLWLHSFKYWMSSWNCWNGADFYNWESSAKQTRGNEQRVTVNNIRTGCGIQNKEKESHSRPCGTPQEMGTGAELQSLTATVWVMFKRQE